VVIEGHKIKSDPGLVSRELAPVNLSALWNQRLRWAQGWFQVSRRHIWPALTSGRIGWRQKFGLFHLLLWREVYPWLSLQMWPIIAFWVWKHGSVREVDWLIPIFVLTTLFTLSVGPGQVFFAYSLAAADVRRHKSWFWLYLFWAPFYSELKNCIGRVAQVKELMGERAWKVTPRAAATPGLEPAERLANPH
jgi:cellulose synthase/poly-beta-1,6-N-acetylglucosamine synthase-like glycosyltransferase